MKTSKAGGFTLMEVMLVIILLASVLFPLLQTLSSGMIASGETRDTNMAMVLAQRKLEELKNSTFSSITSEAKAALSGNPAFSRSVLVADTATNLKDVKVMIYWRPGAGSEMGITLETYISNF